MGKVRGDSPEIAQRAAARQGKSALWIASTGPRMKRIGPATAFHARHMFRTGLAMAYARHAMASPPLAIPCAGQRAPSAAQRGTHAGQRGGFTKAGPARLRRLPQRRAWNFVSPRRCRRLIFVACWQPSARPRALVRSRG